MRCSITLTTDGRSSVSDATGGVGTGGTDVESLSLSARYLACAAINSLYHFCMYSAVAAWNVYVFFLDFISRSAPKRRIFSPGSRSDKLFAGRLSRFDLNQYRSDPCNITNRSRHARLHHVFPFFRRRPVFCACVKSLAFSFFRPLGAPTESDELLWTPAPLHVRAPSRTGWCVRARMSGTERDGVFFVCDAGLVFASLDSSTSSSVADGLTDKPSYDTVESYAREDCDGSIESLRARSECVKIMSWNFWIAEGENCVKALACTFMRKLRRMKSYRLTPDAVVLISRAVAMFLERKAQKRSRSHRSAPLTLVNSSDKFISFMIFSVGDENAKRLPRESRPNARTVPRQTSQARTPRSLRVETCFGPRNYSSSARASLVGYGLPGRRFGGFHHELSKKVTFLNCAILCKTAKSRSLCACKAF